MKIKPKLNKVSIKGIKEEIKRLSKLLNDIHVDRRNIITNIEGIRHREQDVFETDGIEIVDARVNENGEEEYIIREYNIQKEEEENKRGKK
jgi:hypothetical protein